MNAYPNDNIIINSLYMVSLFSIEKDKGKNISITNLKLQKLMYFVEAYYMTIYSEDKYMFSSSWNAWDYGPVNRELYDYFKKFGSMEIEITASEKETIKSLSQENKQCIEKIFEVFGGLSAFDLVTLTHLQGSPWSLINEANNVSKRYNFENINESIISKEDTKNWFKKTFSFILDEENTSGNS